MRLEPQEPARNETLPPIGHVTDILNEREDARLALESYHERRRLGLQVAAKTGKVYEVGETRQFYVHVSTLDSTTRTKKSFELKQQSSVANIWVELGELQNGHVKDEVLAELSHALLTATPEGSYNPNQGIIANNNEVFGNPPDVDGDGLVDILLYDVPDLNEGTVVAGFVWGGDLCTANTSPSGCSEFSNQADVLYLDTNPLLTELPVETLLEVAAHEYQHLIHFAYDDKEATFVNEGLSEWAERLNGYRGRTITYLSSESERNISLFTWRTGADVLKDYARGSLFTTYLAERVGPEVVGSITRQRPAGAFGYRAALEPTGIFLEDLIADFHTANLLNGLTVNEGEHYGYVNPHLQNVRASASAQRTVDGRKSSSTKPSSVVVQGGGSVYLRWEHVTDFQISLDLENASPFIYDAARVRIVIEESGENIRVEPFTLAFGGFAQTFEGTFDAITVVATHTRPVINDGAAPVTYNYSASWGGGQEVKTELVQYDLGRVDGDFGFFQLNPSGTGVVATRFEVPDPTASLGRVFVNPYYLSQFENGEQAPEAPRDLTLHVWADAGNGSPGDELFSMRVTDSRAFEPVLEGDYRIRFHAVDLSAEKLYPLPPVIHVGYSEYGDDGNNIVLGLMRYASENVSHVGTISDAGTTWSSLWDKIHTPSNGDPDILFTGKAVPIRAEFLIGFATSTDEVEELPSEITLAQNFPNPFNPATTISYSIPTAGQVRLGVYDMTGRLVASLVDETMPSGDHTIHFDASAYASGVYMYVLETGGTRIARKMLLLK